MLCTFKQAVSSNNQSMFVIHATGRKLLKPEKKIKKEHFTICSVLRDLRLLLKKEERERECEQKTGRRYWILWQLCEICQMSEGWKKQHITLSLKTHSVSVLISPYVSGFCIGLRDLPRRSWIFHPDGELVVSCYGPQAKVCQAASTLHKHLPKLCMGGMGTVESNEIILVWPWIMIICPPGAEVLCKCITTAHAEVIEGKV